MKNFEQDFTLPPFPAFPCASRYIPIGPVFDAFSRVSRSIFAREAISLIIGPPGTGKSLACALLAKEFGATHNVIAIGETSIVDEVSFYRFVLHRLGVAFDNAKREELELLIHERLCGGQANPNGAILIIDEAASLSAEVLESIRRLTNLMRNDQPMVSAVVAGGVKLDETLTAPSLEPFVQRVTARCYLHPLNLDETRQYIQQCIAACEADPAETIADEAIANIFHATGGVTRLINQIMTEAIDCAAEMNELMIGEHTINKAWSNLQQLPSPMVEEPSIEPQSSVVEFGELVETLPMQETPSPADEIKSELVAESINKAEQEAALELAFYDSADDEANAESIVETFEQVAEFPTQTAEGSGVQETPDPLTLFGEFDDEENINVGTATAEPMQAEPAGLELESMLHSQIIGLSQFASENTAARLAASESEPASDPLFEDAFGDTEASEAPSVIWYDEPVAQEEPTSQDDTDLLWITEDIDVERRLGQESGKANPHRVDPATTDAPKLKVDYREMLEKMRNHA